MIGEYARVARPYFVLLAIVTTGRWLQGSVFHVDYHQGTDKLSIVILTIFASVFSTIFLRRWLGWPLLKAAGFGAFLALCAQVVILLSTVASYGLGVASYFNHPLALNRPETEVIGLGTALGIRAGGLVVNTILNGIVGSLGWALGGLLPVRSDR